MSATASAAPAQQERPSWKSEAIRRGNLRITGPSPADLPPVGDDVEDDEEPQPLSPKRFTDSHTVPDRKSANSPTRRRLLHKASLDITHRMGVTERFLPGHKRTSTEIQETIVPSNYTPEPASDYSRPYASASTTPTAGRPTKRQKRGSLSAAFKKIFGSKKRHDRERSRTASPTRHQYHNSEPLVRRASPPRTFTTEPRGGTSDSENIPSFTTDVGRGTPVQLPFPMNVNAPQEESTEQDYISFNRTQPVHRRRATLPSVVFNSTDTATLSAIWSENASKYDDQSVKDDIGVAVSSPHQRQSLSSLGPNRRSNRRSRSAGALEDLRRQHEKDPSTRDSIASSLWQSRYAGSRPATSHVPVTEEEDVIMQDEVFETPAEGASRASSRDTVTRASPSQHKHSLDDDEIKAFDFGPLRDSPAAKQQEFESPIEPPFISLDERMERLESNMRYFDESLRRLHGRQNRQTIILENAPPGRTHSRNVSSLSQDSTQSLKRPSAPFADYQQVPSPVSLSSSPSHAAHFAQVTGMSDQSSQPYYSPNQYSHNPPHHRYPSPKTSLPNLINSPSITTMSSAPTMVATAGAPPPSSHSYTEQHSYAPDQMSTLYSLLYHERAARKDLEAQVDELRREMGELRLRVDRQFPRSHPDAYANGNANSGRNDYQRGNGQFKANGGYTKTHTVSNLYNYAAYPGAQNAYPTPSPDVILPDTTASSTEHLPVQNSRISQLNYEEEAAKQRKSHFSLESDELDLPDSGCASKRHSSSLNLSQSQSQHNSQHQSFVHGNSHSPSVRDSNGDVRDSGVLGGPVGGSCPIVVDRSSSVYRDSGVLDSTGLHFDEDDDVDMMHDDADSQDDDLEEKMIEEYQTPMEEPDSPPPRDGEEVFRGVGVAVGGPRLVPIRKSSVGRI